MYVYFYIYYCIFNFVILRFNFYFYTLYYTCILAVKEFKTLLLEYEGRESKYIFGILHPPTTCRQTIGPSPSALYLILRQHMSDRRQPLRFNKNIIIFIQT